MAVRSLPRLCVATRGGHEPVSKETGGIGPRGYNRGLTQKAGQTLRQVGGVDDGVQRGAVVVGVIGAAANAGARAWGDDVVMGIL